MDTNALIWWLAPNSNASPYQQKALELIGNTTHQIYVSVISLVEIVIKRSIGKLGENYQLQDIRELCDQNGFTVLSLEMRHLDSFFELPLHHRDPFDRLLIAQAMAERLTLITSGQIFAQYKSLKLHLLQKP